VARLRQVGKRNTHGQLGIARARCARDQAFKQRRIGGEAAVHLPIAHDEALASVAHWCRRSSQTGMFSTAARRLSMGKRGLPLQRVTVNCSVFTPGAPPPYPGAPASAPGPDGRGWIAIPFRRSILYLV